MTKGRIPEYFINDLLARTDIVSIIEERLPLKKKGSSHSACCPFHQEKTPSFSVSATKQFYYCFGCGASGNAITFLMEYEHLTFTEAIEDLAQLQRLTIPYEHSTKGPINKLASAFTDTSTSDLYGALQQAQRLYQWQLRQPDNRHAIEYLKTRGLSGDIAKQFALGFAPDRWDSLRQHLKRTPVSLLIKAGLLIQKDAHSYDRFRDRIMFPIRDRRGRTIGFGGRVMKKDQEPKYLNSPETAVFHKGRELYGLYEVLEATKGKPDCIIVTEGYMDVIALFQAGFNNVVATLGTATSQDHLRILFRYTHHIIFCFDGDTAGRAAAKRALYTALRFMTGDYQVEFLFLPQGTDPDSIVQQSGPSGFNAQLNNAQTFEQTLLNFLTEDLDLSRLDHRAQLVQKFKDCYKAIPEGPFLEMLMDQIAAKTLLSRRQIQFILNQDSQGGGNNQAAASHLQPLQPKTLLEKAIAYLLQMPELAHSITHKLPAFNDQTKAFLHLVELIKTHEIKSTGQIIHLIKQDDQLSAYLSVAEAAHPIKKEMIKAEFCDIMSALLNRSAETELNRLILKAKTKALSQEEQQLLQKLLSQLKAQKK